MNKNSKKLNYLAPLNPKKIEFSPFVILVSLSPMGHQCPVIMQLLSAAAAWASVFHWVDIVLTNSESQLDHY